MTKILIVDDQAGWISFNSNAAYEVLGKDIILDTASSARDGYSKLLESKEEPYDYLITDMQMETDFAPKMAGEWLIEQAQNLTFCYRTKIIIVSACPRIKHVAETYGVEYIPKSVAIVSLEHFKEAILH